MEEELRAVTCELELVHVDRVLGVGRPLRHRPDGIHQVPLQGHHHDLSLCKGKLVFLGGASFGEAKYILSSLLWFIVNAMCGFIEKLTLALDKF